MTVPRGAKIGVMVRVHYAVIGVGSANQPVEGNPPAESGSRRDRIVVPTRVVGASSAALRGVMTNLPVGGLPWIAGPMIVRILRLWTQVPFMMIRASSMISARRARA